MRAGLRPLDDVRALNARFVPVLENHPQISSLEITDRKTPPRETIAP